MFVIALDDNITTKVAYDKIIFQLFSKIMHSPNENRTSDFLSEVLLCGSFWEEEDYPAPM
jgi:hypothetical protein